MKLCVLVENNSSNKELKAMHGISFYIETDKHKILIDVGNKDVFIRNANKLGIDISDIDTLIITHGHNDHGGGLKHFLGINQIAKIFIQRTAFLEHYVKVLGILKINVGLDDSLMKHNRIILLDGDHVIDDEIKLIANPIINYLKPKFNELLYEKRNHKLMKDNFEHEQSIIIKDKKVALIGGCAHNGIINIINDAERKINSEIDYVISGFHLFNPATQKTEDESSLDVLFEQLSNKKAKFYTCHCTGTKAYEYLKQKLKNKIEYISVGDEINL